MGAKNDDLPNYVVTEVVTLVRVWRVRAASPGDAQDRVKLRSQRGYESTSPPERVWAATDTRWAAARGEK